ncbi:F-box only protein 32 [Nasonia vitripennis]|uniref:F-box only protein 32 n=1 Tax=Nasonia vitripennis TaxID=7425 RepID=A0A7M7G1Y4_NASVI|nr:F-box only protein 32 [Nasonia vitripennis]
MPFISKDWRSPGEEWVKTVEGWEKKKILECANNKTLSLLLRAETNGDKREKEKEKEKKKEDAVQPHCHITLKCTREIAGFNGLSDALKRLDFLSAVHDCRRFNYIVRLLDLLVSHRMGGLSGCAQRVLFNMLEEVALEVSLSQQQTGRLRRLIERVRAFSAGCCWGGRPLGSVILWEKHKAALDRILQIASSITITQPDEEQQPQWSDLPAECRREVLLRLSDPRDIEASSEACEHLAVLAQEQRIWRELAQYHFTPQQIATARQNNPEKDWKTIFTIARRSFGLREEYAEMIQLCRNCRCLFWRSLGHPCIADQDPAFQEKLADVDRASLHVPIPPQTFLKFFSL